MTEAEEPFFLALTGDAGDVLRRLIFADWLDERDDPRGAWVRVGCELDGLAENDDRRPALETRKRELRDQHRDTVDEWDRRFALTRIKHKLARATDAKRIVAFNPVLSEDELTAFEREHRVSLPEGYRAFLSEIGNGGPGPGEGLPSLAEAVRYAPTSDFATPFPLSMREWAEATERAERGDADFPEEMDYALPGVLWVGDPWKDWERAYLVVTGEDRGMVWGMGLIDGGWGPDVRAGYDDARWEKKIFRNFLMWYEDWLNDTLAVESAPPGA